MKIIAKSNFDLETVNDFLVAEHINKTHGEVAVEAFNTAFCSDPSAPYFYKLVEDSYQLYTWEP